MGVSLSVWISRFDPSRANLRSPDVTAAARVCLDSDQACGRCQTLAKADRHDLYEEADRAIKVWSLSFQMHCREALELAYPPIWSSASSSDAVGRSSPLGDRPRAVGNPTEGALDDDECRGGLDDLAGGHRSVDVLWSAKQQGN
ncbi:hypothetical protein [Bradyrhizobium symbiodeficiens]|uniref:Uncharacterized protein n=1 Tax=Bradyrhizobium symbiodeficiens TaxID=1404367 RepID=A0A6G9A9W3_9BRAD|nr:hypothetical protein [Bradyrhizobium symbiodeficiens]QIP09116.1 hypothetical protein HAV00_23940 [Bradyrhizobium symbiodeficiens]